MATAPSTPAESEVATKFCRQHLLHFASADILALMHVLFVPAANWTGPKPSHPLAVARGSAEDKHSRTLIA